MGMEKSIAIALSFVLPIFVNISSRLLSWLHLLFLFIFPSAYTSIFISTLSVLTQESNQKYKVKYPLTSAHAIPRFVRFPFHFHDFRFRLFVPTCNTSGYANGYAK